MNAVDYIKTEMAMGKGWIGGLMADTADIPLTAPTPNGGNYPQWIVGHMAYSESNILNTYIRGIANPLEEWKDIFGIGSQPSIDGADYPAIEELLKKYDEVRAETIAYLETITDADLDNATHAPEEAKDFFGTVGQCLAIMSTHLAFHGGQLADARRAAGKDILMA